MIFFHCNVCHLSRSNNCIIANMCGCLLIITEISSFTRYFLYMWYTFFPRQAYCILLDYFGIWRGSLSFSSVFQFIMIKGTPAKHRNDRNCRTGRKFFLFLVLSSYFSPGIFYLRNSDFFLSVLRKNYYLMYSPEIRINELQKLSRLVYLVYHVLQKMVRK